MIDNGYMPPFKPYKTHYKIVHQNCNIPKNLELKNEVKKGCGTDRVR